jgi:hypothetical protein
MCNRGITYLRAFNVIAIIKKIKRRPVVSLAFPESAWDVDSNAWIISNI